MANFGRLLSCKNSAEFVLRRTIPSKRLRELYDRNMPSIAAFVLTGGRSSRMGSDKAFLELEGKALIARAIELARKVTPNVSIVGASEKYSAYGPVVADIFPRHGPLGGIHAALRASRSDLNLMMAVDLPFLEARFLEYLIARAAESDAPITVPKSGEYFQPLCAVYRKEFANIAERALAKGRNKIDSLFDEVNLCTLTEEDLTTNGFDLSMFRNLNTQADWKNAKVEFEQK
jgi:molybdenum cofactor guanylyltransferase